MSDEERVGEIRERLEKAEFAVTEQGADQWPDLLRFHEEAISDVRYLLDRLEGEPVAWQVVTRTGVPVVHGGDSNALFDAYVVYHSEQEAEEFIQNSDHGDKMTARPLYRLRTDQGEGDPPPREET